MLSGIELSTFAATTGVVIACRVPEIRCIVLRSVTPIRERGDNEEDLVLCKQLH